MKLGILSDTHNQVERTRQAVQLLLAAGAEELIHCGDITGPDVIRVCSALPCHYVFGNNDDGITELQDTIAETGGDCLMWAGELVRSDRRIGVAHGHLHTDIRMLLASQPDYLLTGHSHIPHDQRIDSTRRINPGALHRATHFSVAVLDLQTDDLIFVPVPR